MPLKIVPHTAAKIWFIVLLFCSCPFFAQTKKTDSLFSMLKKYSSKSGFYNDSLTYTIYWELGLELEYNDPDTALYYFSKAEMLAAKLKSKYMQAKVLSEKGWCCYIKGDNANAVRHCNQCIAICHSFHSSNPAAVKDMQFVLSSALGNLGSACSAMGNPVKAIGYYNKCLEIHKKFNNAPGVATALGNIGSAYIDQGNYDVAIDYTFKSLKINEQLNNKPAQVNALINIGAFYLIQKDHDKALSYFFKAYKLSQATGGQENQAKILDGIATSYSNKGNYDSAIVYCSRSLKVSEELGNKMEIAATLGNIGNIYADQGNKPKALEYYLKALNMNEEIGFKNGMAINLGNIGTLYSETGQHSKGVSYLNQAIAIGREMNMNYELNGLYLSLSELYQKTNKPLQALEAYKQHIAYRDSVFNAENRSASIKKEMQFEFEKQQAADSIKIAEERFITRAKFEQEKTQRYALYGVLAITAVFALFMVNRFRVTNRQRKIIEAKEIETQKQNSIISQQKHLVEEKHKEITDSINYAERIQRSFLASRELLDENLKDYFVLFRPKDVVSGDFYWASSLPVPGRTGTFAMAVADSTGHGVPGAIMSLLNITSLENAIKETGDPAAILNLTRTTIIERLKKDGSAEGGKDGMDCSLMTFDFVNRRLFAALANNPLWIVRKEGGTAGLIEIKPDKMPVGKHDKDQQSFTLHTMDLKTGDMVYALTDGFPDQFGGPGGKKFMSKKLKELVVQHSDLDLQEQKAILEQTLVQWIGGLEQVDDITLVGIRICW
jgi:tetratricopeptide (TPR) repeat protein